MFHANTPIYPSLAQTLPPLLVSTPISHAYTPIFFLSTLICNANTPISFANTHISNADTPSPVCTRHSAHVGGLLAGLILMPGRRGVRFDVARAQRLEDAWAPNHVLRETMRSVGGMFVYGIVLAPMLRLVRARRASRLASPKK